jgi:hypothetical protein
VFAKGNGETAKQGGRPQEIGVRQIVLIAPDSAAIAEFFWDVLGLRVVPTDRAALSTPPTADRPELRCGDHGGTTVARFGRIDRSSQTHANLLRCRRTEARKTAPRPSLMKLF